MKKFLFTVLVLSLICFLLYINMSDRDSSSLSALFKTSTIPRQIERTFITIRLNNGTEVHGELLSETDAEMIIAWQGGEMSLMKHEVEIVDRETRQENVNTTGPSAKLINNEKRSLQERFLNFPIIKDIVEYIKKLLERIWCWIGGTVENVLVAGKSLRPENMVTVYLVNGSAISGELISEENGIYKVKWQGGVVEFLADEVLRVEHGEVLNTEAGVQIVEHEVQKWTYANDVVIKLYNGEVLDVAIHDISDRAIIVQYAFEGGGSIEQDIDRSKVECFLFKPVENERSTAIKTSLKRLFPAMRFYEEGNTTLVTDSYITWVRKYRSVLLKTQMDIYCRFFKLFKGRVSQVQNFVVVFDNPNDYIEYAISDGVPGWVAPGYFDPKTKVLYLFNMAGERMEDHINGLMRNYYGNVIDTAANRAKSRVDERYHVFVEGTAKDIKDKFWEYFDWWMAQLRRTTISVLQHEFAHELFSNYSLQMVMASKFDQKQFPDLEKKKKFLETDDVDEKSKMLLELMTVHSSETLPDMSAANSWITEGVATYCETDPVGSKNDERIYSFQEMMRKNAFMPLEQLTVYKIGSFPGVYHETMIFAYAQSWALVKFFMERYPDQFISYMKKIAKVKPEGNQDVEWLIEAIGKDTRTIESELIEFMEQFPQIEDPIVQVFQQRKKLQDGIAFSAV